MKRLPFLLFVSGLAAILFLGVIWTDVAQARSTRTFTLEVACDASTAGANFSDAFVPEDDPSPFGPRATVIIVNGNIYPEDSLDPGVTDFVPVPSDPDKIGTWRCQFASLGINDFPLVGAVTYYFQLEPTGYDSEESMIMVQGLNSHTWPDTVPRVLAIVGGTGRYAGATGEVLEEVIGVNASQCFNLRFHFRIRGVRHRRNHYWD